jgi:3-hydroxybutyryl-CoA dehydrogenase
MDRIAVFGAGTMGHGIAQVCAQAGYRVALFDISEQMVEGGLSRIGANLAKGVARGKVTEESRTAALANLSGTCSMDTACEGADFLIEAIPERMDLKHKLLAEIDARVPSSSLIGTNTSSMSISEIASAVSAPERVVGTHFFNPVHIMKLLEIVHHKANTDEVLEAVLSFSARIGKEPIMVRNSPGFATSRLGVALGMEAIRMLEEGVASAEDIDKAMALGYKHPVGPLKLTDMVGLDVRLAIGEYLSETLDNPAFNPPALMRKMVSEGHLGKKSGQGFYRWP